jgi:TolB-like protein/Flp pilus assembly protein TadD
MKKCPQCGREYDATMSFCLDDGAELLYGPAASSFGNGPATAILPEPPASAGGQPVSENPTRPFIHTTAAEAQPRESLGGPSERPSVSAHRAAKPAAGVSANRATKPLIAGAVALVMVASGFFGYRYLSDGGGSGGIDSIAVLPFENRSGSGEADYLSDGLADSLIYRLSQLPNLKVSPTSSVMRYKGSNADVAAIAGELDVDAVMSGRLVQLGDSLNISVQLIDARTKKLLWAEQYDRKMSDLLATQREIATAITQKLELKLAGDEKALTKKYTNNNDAYQLWLRGRFHFARRTKDDMLKSIELFSQAVKLDPNFALAYVGIAESYSTIPSYPYGSPEECVPQARAAVAKALEIDPDLPEAHTVAGMIAATHDWDYPKAERAFKRSLELDPDLAATHYRYAWVYLSPLGRHDEAVAEMKRAMELEPLSVQQGANFAAVLMYAGRFDEALEQAKKTYELDPTHVGGMAWLAHCYNAKGMYDESLAVSAKLESITSYQSRAQRGISYALSGQREKALRVVSEWREAEKSDYVMIYWLAATYALLGEKEAAFAELERSYKARDWFLHRLKTDPFMNPVRDDPRYKNLLKRLNLPE